MLEHLIKSFVPFIIHLLEIMGVIVLTVGAFVAFYQYIKEKLFKQTYPLKYQFANSMVTALEFKLAAEILKTVLVRTLNELLILAAIFLLRVLMNFVLEREIKMEDEKKGTS